MIVPHDVEAERSMLAELADPLTGRGERGDWFGWLRGSDFWLPAHRRLFTALRVRHERGLPPPRHDLGALDVSAEDLAVLDEAIAHAWPLHCGTFHRVRELGETRERIAAIELELAELYGSAA